MRRPDFNEADVADKPAFYRGLEPVPEERTDRARREHHAALLAVDDAIRAIHGRVAARGQLGRTVFVSLSDNGFSFGEHRWVGKRCPYEECVRTPLRIRLPGAGGGRVARLASNVDIAPTILELAGVARPRGLNGRSLVGVLRGRAGAWRTEVLLRGKREPGPHPPSFWGLRTARHKYVQTEGTGEVELYDLLADPFELNNLAGSAKHARLRAYFARRLATLRR